MTQVARSAAISQFAEEDRKGIRIASLKCGGVGLNLVMASKVFNVDLWWSMSLRHHISLLVSASADICLDSAVEQQAYCRIFRIGQKLETYFQRVVVRDTIDERLLAMQKRKDRIIKRALGDDGMKPERFTVT